MIMKMKCFWKIFCAAAPKTEKMTRPGRIFNILLGRKGNPIGFSTFLFGPEVD